MKIIYFFFFFLFLSGCSASGEQDSVNAATTLSTYLQAFTDKNEAQMSTMLCKQWSQDALLEYDAFQGVETTLDGLSCSVTSVEPETILVNCQGKIQASYQNEIQEFDLEDRVYRLQKNGSDWLVCGYSTP